MGKIIRVNGCHDCPCMDFNYDKYGDFHSVKCVRLGATNLKIGKHVDNQTLPDNCPFDDSPDLRGDEDEDKILADKVDEIVNEFKGTLPIREV